MTLYNSNSSKVNEAMRAFVESERNFRRIKQIEENEETKFIDWKITDSMNSGTDTIIVHALRSSVKLGFKFIINKEEESNKLEAEIKVMDDKKSNREGEEAQQEITINVKTPRELMKQIMENIRKTHQQELVNNEAVGHSFRNIKDSSYANMFIGDRNNSLNDNIACWIIKARSNMLLTGSKARKIKLSKANSPHCPYCGSYENDTLAHRINGCKMNRNQLTKRHNSIQNIILSYMKQRLSKKMKIKTNATLNLEGHHLTNDLNRFKPDIIAWSKKSILIVEFSCPYDNIVHGNSKLEKVYKDKTEKYAELVEECKRTYDRKVKFFAIIVSSLGAVYKKSIGAIKRLLRIVDKKLLNTVLRRISIAACIGSYMIFNNFKFEELETKDEKNKEVNTNPFAIIDNYSKEANQTNVANKETDTDESDSDSTDQEDEKSDDDFDTIVQDNKKQDEDEADEDEAKGDEDEIEADEDETDEDEADEDEAGGDEADGDDDKSLKQGDEVSGDDDFGSILQGNRDSEAEEGPESGAQKI